MHPPFLDHLMAKALQGLLRCMQAVRQVGRSKDIKPNRNDLQAATCTPIGGKRKRL